MTDKTPEELKAEAWKLAAEVEAALEEIEFSDGELDLLDSLFGHSNSEDGTEDLEEGGEDGDRSDLDSLFGDKESTSAEVTGICHHEDRDNDGCEPDSLFEDGDSENGVKVKIGTILKTRRTVTLTLFSKTAARKNSALEKTPLVIKTVSATNTEKKMTPTRPCQPPATGSKNSDSSHLAEMHAQITSPSLISRSCRRLRLSVVAPLDWPH
jgi:hypothetical protein